ncbi:heterokaryon incompatibility protein-domain-containing protein [Corynascus novoguineensis]|uniref:Heterokaryon incompatibility protein-domain-containing protein n=1 Tax=Corynascus novoguineensis TaxID=1126955 RepID=A0AAN7HPW8_9PEZI|nr:heterokaryon incompatibility protein-domain-containing protein [Corynascus novoguineensis]
MNANQSRRLIDPGTSSVSNNTKAKTDNATPYQGRELDNDSIRLVEIEPAAHGGDAVVCRLSVVPFASRPKFEALSYRWGTENEKGTITLNGLPFEVTRNLLDALLFLRRQAASGEAHQPFWIDAICINQSDVAERNRQLRIMKEIYLRASTVVVWLGSRYAEFQSDLAAKESHKPEGGSPQRDNSIQREMIQTLQKDEYWGRLWIIQEIGEAKQLRVCFGDMSASWDVFMDLLAMHHCDGDTGPLRLDRLLRKEKYSGSHTLKRLLEEHREAKCAEPRDKIYGLVGLASDAAGFLMDYNKSLYEVWKDTMEFMNYRELFETESQILPVGALVKSLLMANYTDPWSQILKVHEDQVDSTKLIVNPDRNNPLVFRLTAVLLGCIGRVGPSAGDIVARPSESLRWRANIQQLFSADELGPAHQENDRLLRILLASDDSEVAKMCFNRPSTVCWKQFRIGSTHWGRYFQSPGQQTRLTTLGSSSRTKTPRSTDQSNSVQPRLYMVKGSFYHPTPRKMGVASGLVRPGDLVCYVKSSKRTLLIRAEEESNEYTSLRVFGTALTTDDMCGSIQDADQVRQWRLLKEDVKRRVEVQLDAGTIFMLLE